MISFFLKYVTKFLLLFCILYFGSQLVIGLTSPGNYYSSFVHQYLDYISVLRKSLLVFSKFILSVLGYDSVIQNSFRLKIVNGASVRMVYSCLAIGIFSFWGAFVMANNGKVLKKAIWIVVGFIAIWLINITRICLLIIATNNEWPTSFKINHHTFFNIAAYGAIFLLMYFFDRSQKKIESESSS